MPAESVAGTTMTKTTDAESDDISLKMPDDLAQQINECIQKYNGTDDASQGSVQGLIYDIGGKRFVLKHDLQ